MFDKILRPFRIKYEMLCRMFFWGWKLRNNWDFDGETVYGILELKLERMYDCFKADEYHVWCSSTENKRMRQLSEAILLCKRLNNNYYENMSFAEIDAIFGDPSFHFVQLDNWFHSMEVYRPRVKTQEDKEFFSKEYKRIMNKYSKLHKQDQERFYYLLNNNVRQWWT